MGLIGPNGLEPGAIARVLGGRWLTEPRGETAVFGASIDTRSLKAGEIFFALRGEHSDGHRYLDKAAAGRASIAIVERDGLDVARLAPMGVLLVGDVRTALGVLGRAYRDALDGVRVVGVTGSNGKTTTVRFVHAALAGSRWVTCSAKSFNNDLGLPLTLLAARPGDEVILCEMGTNAPGEIAGLVELARPDVGVVTSIGRSHLEALGSVEGVASEKATLVRTLRAHGFAVVTADSAALDAALEGFDACPITRVGLAERADIRVDEIRTTARGVSCVVNEQRLEAPTPGAHNALNAAIALTVACRLGVEPGAAARGIASATPPPMRLERVEIDAPGGPIYVINDAYNANPESMLAAVAMLGRGDFDPSGGRGRRIAVLGEMLEMGGASADAHDEIARALAETDIDGVILVGSRAERMASVIAERRPGAVLLVEPDADSGWPDRAAGVLAPGDTVLLKGSRGMRLERVLDALGSARPARIG